MICALWRLAIQRLKTAEKAMLTTLVCVIFESCGSYVILFRRRCLAACWNIPMGHRVHGEIDEGVRIAKLFSGLGGFRRL